MSWVNILTPGAFMTFETFNYLFCISVGVVFGIVHFVYKCLTTGCPGLLICLIGEKHEEGGLKILSSWNLGLSVVFTVLFLLWASGKEGWYVHQIVRQSWDYFVTQGFIV